MDTLSSNILLTNNYYYNRQIEDLTAKVKNYQLNTNAKNCKNEQQNEMHQKKLNFIAKVNTQVSVGLQNELVKTILFNNK
jgi:hypothetical protein